jgi:hypothetical protein
MKIEIVEREVRVQDPVCFMTQRVAQWWQCLPEKMLQLMQEVARNVERKAGTHVIKTQRLIRNLTTQQMMAPRVVEKENSVEMTMLVKKEAT